jgi:hypothetical protein
MLIRVNIKPANSVKGLMAALQTIKPMKVMVIMYLTG